MIILMLAAAFTSNSAPSEAQLATRRGDEEIIPAYFQGTWGRSLKDCADPEGTGKIVITATRIEGYELDARLLKIGRIRYGTAPGGGQSHYAELLLAESGEGRIGLETLVISRVRDKLYWTWKVGSKDLTDAQLYKDPDVLCAGSAK